MFETADACGRGDNETWLFASRLDSTNSVCCDGAPKRAVGKKQADDVCLRKMQAVQAATAATTGGGGEKEWTE